MEDKKIFKEVDDNLFKSLNLYYCSYEKMISQRKFDCLFKKTKELSLDDLLKIYYNLGKAYSGIFKGWLREVCSKNEQKKIYVFERDCGILRYLNQKIYSIWINYDIIKNKQFKQYVSKLDYKNSIFLDIGILGTLPYKIMKQTGQKIVCNFLYSLNDEIVGYLNRFTSEYSQNFFISLVRTIEYVCKPIKKPTLIPELENIVKLRYENRLYSLIYENFIKGVIDNNYSLKKSLRTLFELYLNNLDKDANFNGFIVENYTIDAKKIQKMNIKYREELKKHEIM